MTEWDGYDVVPCSFIEKGSTIIESVRFLTRNYCMLVVWCVVTYGSMARHWAERNNRSPAWFLLCCPCIEYFSQACFKNTLRGGVVQLASPPFVLELVTLTAALLELVENDDINWSDLILDRHKVRFWTKPNDGLFKLWYLVMFRIILSCATVVISQFWISSNGTKEKFQQSNFLPID